MPKNRNMGRKSHRVQDIQLKQNITGINEEVGDQPTRPTVHKHEGTKSSREEPRDTK